MAIVVVTVVAAVIVVVVVVVAVVSFFLDLKISIDCVKKCCTPVSLDVETFFLEI